MITEEDIGYLVEHKDGERVFVWEVNEEDSYFACNLGGRFLPCEEWTRIPENIKQNIEEVEYD